MRHVSNRRVLTAGGFLGGFICCALVLAGASTGGKGSILGDMNFDGLASLDDIEPFVIAVRTPDAWRSAYKATESDRLARGDFNNDGVINVDDAGLFGSLIGANLASSSGGSDGGGDSQLRAAFDPGVDARRLPGAAITYGALPACATQPSDPPTCPGCDDVEYSYCNDWAIDLDLKYPTSAPCEEIQRVLPLSSDPAYSSEEDECSSLLLVASANVDDDDGDGLMDFGSCGPSPDESGELVPVRLYIGVPAATTQPVVNALTYTLCSDNSTGLLEDYRPRIWRSPIKEDSSGATLTNPAFWGEVAPGETLGEIDFVVRGDMDCSGSVTPGDVSLFVQYLTSPSAVLDYCPDACPTAGELADTNADGVISVGDIAGFVAAASGTQRLPAPRCYWVEGGAQPDLVKGQPNVLSLTASLALPTGASTGCPLDTIHDTVRIQTTCATADWYAPILRADGNCDDDFSPRCWGVGAKLYEGTTVAGLFDNYPDDVFQRPSGFPLQLDLATGFGPPDLPPRTLDPRLGSMPMVPADVRLQSGPNAFLERQTLDGVMDLATGLPLLQDVDFELPFGGAMFRHLRTFSDNPGFIFAPLAGSAVGKSTSSPRGSHWAWAGTRWMIGQNPILLIDAGYLGLINRPDDAGDKQFCYLISDAHHSVPFEKVSEGVYSTAPGWDASLTVSGGYYLVKLAQGSVTYKFEPMLDDVWTVHSETHGFVSAHELPADGGHGIPHWGRLVEITDRYGNKVVNDYCGESQFACDPAWQPQPSSVSCQACCQSCNQKGALVRTTLVPAGDDQPLWTILYSYREFARKHTYEDKEKGGLGELGSCCVGYGGCEPGVGSSAELDPETGIQAGLAMVDCRDPLQYRLKLHNVYVYRGNVAAPEACPVIPADKFLCHSGDCASPDTPAVHRVQTFQEYDEIQHPVFEDKPYDSWVKQVRYLYTEVGTKTYDINDDGGGAPCYSESGIQYERAWWLDGPAILYAGLQTGALLVKVSVAQKEEIERPDNYTFYRYALSTADEASDHNGGVLLSGVFYNDTVDRLLHAADNAPLVEAPTGQCGLTDCLQETIPTECGDCCGKPHLYRDGERCRAERVNELMLCSPNDTAVSDWFTKPNGELEAKTVALISAADLAFIPGPHDGGSGYRSTYRFDAAALARSMNIEGAGANNAESKLLFPESGYLAFFDRRNGAGKKYVLWTMLRGDHATDIEFTHVFASAYRYPYFMPALQVMETGYGPFADEAQYVPIDAEKGFYITIVDELTDDSPIEGVYNNQFLTFRNLGSGNDYSPGGISGWTDVLGVKRRTVYEFNPQGLLVSKRGFNVVGSTLVQTEADGNEEQATYRNGRLTQLRSSGWVVANNHDVNNPLDPTWADHLGLITEFCYDSECSSADPGLEAQIAKISVRQGSEGEDLVALQEFEHDLVARPELVTKTTRHSGVGAPEVTWIIHTLDGDDRITQRKTVQPGAARTLGGAPYYSTRIEILDAAGRVTWEGFGSFPNSDGTGAPVEFFANYTQYDGYGRELMKVVDVNPKEAIAGTTWPSGWTRQALPDETLNPPKHLVTTFEYNWLFGLEKVTHPNGRFTYIKYFYPEPTVNVVRQRIYKDVRDGGGWPLSPVTQNLYRGGELIETRECYIYVTDEPDGEEPIVHTITVTTPRRNAQGQVTGASQAENDSDANPVSTHAMIGIGGNVLREQGPDGTLTRRIFDFSGRLQRMFRGTRDSHDFWGLDLCCDEPLSGDCVDECGNEDDDMALIETYAYGRGVPEAGEPEEIGVTNVGEITRVMRFREKPDSQYGQCDPWKDWDCPKDPPPNNEEQIGWPTHIGYDWRMRPVTEIRLTSVEAGTKGVPKRLSSSATWFDNLGRAIFEAEYGETGGPDANPGGGGGAFASVDPRTFDIDSALPSVAALIATAPTRLTHTIYNPAGSPQEVREYWPGSGLDDQYKATRAFFGLHGKPVEQWSPGRPPVFISYNAMGQEIRRETRVSGDVISRTDMFYDENGRSIVIGRTERLHDEDDIADGVTTWTRNWYDAAGRLQASAEVGTGESTFIKNADPAWMWGFLTHNDTSENNPARYTTGTGDVPLLNECVFPDGFPAGTRVSCYEHDRAGRQTMIWNPDNTKDRTVYDGRGRVIAKIRNAEPDEKQGELAEITVYRYECQGEYVEKDCEDESLTDCKNGGRLLAIAAILPGHALYNSLLDDPSTAKSICWMSLETDANAQFTRLDYGAPVVAVAGATHGVSPSTFESAGVNKNPMWLSKVTYPDGDTLEFNYYGDGSLAQRRDTRGVITTHDYDGLGRRETSHIYDVDFFAGADEEWVPTQRVKTTKFQYNALGLLVAASLYSVASGEAIAASTVYGYDSRRQLTSDQQMADYGSINEFTRTTGYAWQYAGQIGGEDDRIERLQDMQYAGTSYDATGLQLTMAYGSSLGVDDVHSRITQIVGDRVSTSPLELATFAYAGSSRRIARTWGEWSSSPALTQSFAGGSGYSGLTTFGEIGSLQTDCGGGSCLQYDYTYDSRGNRLTARVDQVGAANTRSYAFGYDGLQRLKSAELGVLSSGSITYPTGGLRRAWTWWLDALGNWVGDGGAGLARTDQTGTSTEFNEDVTHAVNDGNSLTSVEVDPDGAGGTSPTTVTFLHDAAGNLTFDGEFVYLYDGYNRLVRVLRGGHLSATSTYFSLTGATRGRPIVDETVLNADDHLVADYGYDAFGRLVWKRFFVGREDVADPDPDIRHFAEAHYVYDGARRIQETFVYSDETAEFLWSSTHNNEDNRPLCTAWDGSGCVEYRLEHEYIYGSDYVDELIAIQTADDLYGEDLDDDPDVYYLIQDANYNVVALTNAAGAVLVQYQYDPYGTVATRDVPSPVNAMEVPDLPVGHQGLFFERYYREHELAIPSGVAVATPILSPRAVLGTGSTNGGGSSDISTGPATAGLYYARNRWYSPELGRFTSKDPNQTAFILLDSLSKNGQPFSADTPSLSLNEHYKDGLNLYGFIRNNPVNGLDPLGLDAFDETDWFLSGYAGERAGNAAALMDKVAIAYDVGTMVAGTLFSLTPMGTAVELAQALASGDAATIAVGTFNALGGKFLKALGRARGIFRKLRCNCFVAGTLIGTPDGVQPIEALKVGDWVLTRPHWCPTCEPLAGQITEVFQADTAEVLTIEFSDGQQLQMTPEHVLWEERRGWIEAHELEIGSEVRTLGGEPAYVVATATLTGYSITYNFEVAGSWTYFASGVWVHNNSCPRTRGRVNQAYGHSYEMAGLDANGLAKYHGGKLRANGTNFVPDFMDAGLIGDFKGGEYVCMDDQLRAIAAYANANGLQPVLYVAGNVSAEVRKNFTVIQWP